MCRDAEPEADRVISDHMALNVAIAEVLFHVTNFPERAQAGLLGEDMRPLREKLVDAVQSAGFIRGA